MRIDIIRDGGIAGVRRAISLDTSSLSKTDVETVQLLSTAAKARPTLAVTAAPGLADAFSYEVTISDGGNQTAFSATDANVSPELRALISFVQSHGG